MYYVIEHQKRTDGVVNTSETARSTFASALSLYHERISKMVMNTDFVSVAVMLVDENLRVIEQKQVQTLYTPVSEEEPAEEV